MIEAVPASSYHEGLLESMAELLLTLNTVKLSSLCREARSTTTRHLSAAVFYNDRCVRPSQFPTCEGPISVSVLATWMWPRLITMFMGTDEVTAQE